MSKIFTLPKMLIGAAGDLVKGVFGGGGGDDGGVAAAQSDAAARAAEESAAAKRLETRQVATRGQDLRSAAAAAGASRSGNQFDWLAGGKARPKRKDASKALLGE